MRDLLLLAVHLLVTLAKILRPGGVRAVAAESLALKHQLLICNRSRQRAPNLTTLDRLLLGLTTLFMRPHRIPRLSVIIKAATLLKFHKTVVDGKYRRLFTSSGSLRKPGPKGPSAQLIAAIVEMKRRNPRFGCVHIAQKISHTFGLDINKDVVRRVLVKHYRAACRCCDSSTADSAAADAFCTGQSAQSCALGVLRVSPDRNLSTSSRRWRMLEHRASLDESPPCPLARCFESRRSGQHGWIRRWQPSRAEPCSGSTQRILPAW
jgi:hypothetical protein